MRGSFASHGGPDNGRTGRDAILPSGFDLAVGSACASLWTMLLVVDFPRTAPVTDFLLAATYLGIYLVFLTVASRLIRGVVGRAFGSRVTGSTRRTLERITSVSFTVGLRWFGRIARVSPLLVLAGFAWTAFGSPLIRGGTDLLEIEGTLFKGTAAELSAPDRVTLIAMDGVDMRVVRRLLSEGRLPGFRRIIDHGVSGELQTVSPHSPVVWTSIATGMPVAAHGVRRYTSAWFRHSAIALPVDRRDFVGRILNRLTHFRTIGPVNSNDRRVRAIWELLSLMDRESLVINWWATFPAEPIKGVMISNLAIPWTGFDAHAVAGQASVRHLVEPSRLQPTIVNMLEAFIRGREDDLARPAGTNVAKVDYYEARDDAVFEMLARFSSPTQALSTAYVQGVDTSSHAYTEIVFGPNVNRKRAEQVSEAEAEDWWRKLVLRAYERMDRRIEQLISNLDENESLVIVSDHGWDYDGTSHWNLPPGVFLAYGKPFMAGGRLHGAHVYDVLPTLANLLDIPISNELPGEILVEGFTDESQTKHAALSVPSYGPRTHHVAFSRPSETIGDAQIDRLRNLGYVE